jgi:hypothetical protein
MFDVIFNHIKRESKRKDNTPQIPFLVCTGFCWLFFVWDNMLAALILRYARVPLIGCWVVGPNRLRLGEGGILYCIVMVNSRPVKLTEEGYVRAVALLGTNCSSTTQRILDCRS